MEKRSCSQTKSQQKRWGDYVNTKPRDAQLWKLDSGVTSTLTTPTPSSYHSLSSLRQRSFTGQKFPGAQYPLSRAPHHTQCRLVPALPVSSRTPNLRGVYGRLGALRSRPSSAGSHRRPSPSGNRAGKAGQLGRGLSLQLP